MATKPATSLVNAITARLKNNRGSRIAISRRSLQDWLKWARSIDGRRALDGSKKNRHKRAGR